MYYDNSYVEEKISLFLAFSIDVGLDLRFLNYNYESLREIV